MSFPELEDQELNSTGSLSGATLAAITAMIIAMIGSMTALVWHGSDVTEIAASLAFVPTIILQMFTMRRQSDIAETVHKVEKNTNGNMTALIEKINHVPDGTGQG